MTKEDIFKLLHPIGFVVRRKNKEPPNKYGTVWEFYYYEFPSNRYVFRRIK